MNKHFDKMVENSLILIVEDHIENLKVIVSVLREQNYKTAIASNGLEAIDFIENNSPDLILLDIMMPEMDGYEFCRRAKEMEGKKDIPIIFLTALNSLDNIIKGFELGGVDYITKPFKHQELLVRVRTQLELKVAKDRILKQKNKLEKLNHEKSELLGIVAHDLKNPINTIIGFSKFMQNSYTKNSDEDNLEFVADIRRSAESMFSIVTALLDMNAIEEGKMTYYFMSFDLHEVISSLIHTYTAVAERKNIQINYENPGKEIKTYADINKTNQILDNLISNAIKFSNYDSKIFITVSEEINSSIVAVEDRGPGIPEEEMHLLYQKFSRLSPRPTAEENSTGLGLSITKRLCEEMNGTIKCISKVGVGTKFSVTLPKTSENG